MIKIVEAVPFEYRGWTVEKAEVPRINKRGLMKPTVKEISWSGYRTNPDAYHKAKTKRDLLEKIDWTQDRIDRGGKP